MRFEDSLNEMFDELEIPVELAPSNIALMIKAKSEQSHRKSEHKNNKPIPVTSALRRTITIRTAGAAAACLVLAVGLLSYNKTYEMPDIERPRVYDVPASADSYEQIESIISNIIVESSITSGETVEPKGSITTHPPVTVTEPPETAKTAATQPGTTSTLDESLFSGADLVQSDGNSIYCVFGDTLHIVDMDTMEITAVVEHGLNLPVALILHGDTLILVSEKDEETFTFNKSAAHGNVDNADNSATEEFVPADESDTQPSDIIDPAPQNSGEVLQQSVFTDGAAPPDKTAENSEKSFQPKTNVVLEIFDVKDKASPKHVTSYEQNGRYLASRVKDGAIYIVTSYTDYRVSPLGEGSELENFVPAYFVNGERFFVEPSNIIIPSSASSTDYTVISAIQPDVPDISVKAVLGTGRDVRLDEDNIYFTDSGVNYKLVTSFTLDSAEVIAYGETEFIDTESEYAQNQDNEWLRSQSSAASAEYLLEFTETEEIGISSVYDNSGNTVGLKLGMYSVDNGILINSIDFAENQGVIVSKALFSKRALFLNRENSIIGVPVYYNNQFGTVNQYYVFSYNDFSGFELKGVIEYTDLDESAAFARAVLKGEVIYMIGNGRIVSARIDDMKVIHAITY
ncbi:MAG: beta-propeller domain-containing protein [Oscillospiraceae bacterium]|nr:beta-propeller domain-containing protein [Oscillospiraceae bacterium]